MSTKATAARIYEYGEPDVFRFETMEVPDPIGHEVLVRNTVIGLNFVDIYYRRGTLPVPEFPAIIGDEASGVVEAIGPNVTLVKVGDRVAYADAFGAYTTVRLYPEDRLTVIPDGVTDDQAASSLLKGLTALPAEGNRSTPRRRYRPVPRCSWWSGSDLHAVGKIAWNSRDWNSIDCGESANRSPSGLHSGSQLQHGRLRRTHLRVDWWPGSKGCLRLGRQGYVPGLTRGTETPRHAGSVRQSIGFPGTNQSI
jgi:hypothetical protein